MFSSERKVLVEDLDHGERVLMECLAGATQHEAEWCPSHGAWSILQCLEHLVLSEEDLLTRLEKAQLVL
jgi:hypothetical protein